MTFLDLLKKIQSNGPITIHGEKAFAVEPSVFNYLVKEFEKLSAAQN